MSLDELLKDTNSSSEWMKQRQKLLRIVIGIAVTILAITFLVILIKFQKGVNDPQNNIQQVSSEQSVQDLAQLIQLQKETSDLLNELEKLKRQTTYKNEQNEKALTQPSQINKRVANLKTKSPQIISYDPGAGFEQLVPIDKEAYIPTGAIFQARLITPIKTSVDRTFVMAETTHEYRMDMKRKIPKGSRLIGTSRLNPVLKGVIVEFQTLVLPRGIETQLSGLALSRNALPEIDGLYFSDDLQNYGTALAFGFLSGFADAAREGQAAFFGFRPDQTLSNQVLAGLSTASFQVAEEILRDIRDRAIEYVVIPAGEPVFVALTRRYSINQGTKN